ncbi:phage terminase small subunit P27 family [Hansschlegelia zhihuaiae]|uniref:Phage terminase small subunit P27 family n=1 Tax=Hansschlegelia zhihuaiae TaxID=405005 RepID=A0A4Q0M294_9HYPH|nr:phage terminase small subunit P27 family [Hansschlegelia zhihuaiae]RXF66960.1 phage terminase small subunit P27 family [Hansschlegelia zhihuaiae]
MRGRKPGLGSLSVVGTPSRRRRQEPRPVRGAPTCPAHLLPTAKAEWKRLVRELVDLGMLSALDRAVMAAYCQTYGRWVEAERRLAETPALIKLPSGYVQQNPWLAVANKQLELMHRLMTEMGLTPVARSRVNVKPATSHPKPWEPRACDAYLGSR